MPKTTTRAELAEAISTMSFRDLKLFGEDIVNMLNNQSCESSLDWAVLLSDWAAGASEYEAETSEDSKTS